MADREIQRLRPHSGRFKATFKYTFPDGREVSLGPMFVATEEEAAEKLISKEPLAINILVERDAREAANLGVISAHGEASEQQVKRFYLERGMNTKDTHQAYRLLNAVAAPVLAMGLTDEQYAEAFDTSVDAVTKLKARWAYLETNKDAIEAYELVKEN